MRRPPMAHPIGRIPDSETGVPTLPSDLPDPRQLPADLDPLGRELLERAAGTIRLRAESTRVLLQWKTARRLRNAEQRQAA